MIRRIDRIATELPPPSEPDPRRSGGGSGAHGWPLRGDVHVPELHVPVLQLPQSPGSKAVLRPRGQHRGRGVRSQQTQGLGNGRAPGSASADGLPARSRRRSPGGLRASDRASDRGGPDEALPDAEKIPDCKPHIERGDHLRLYRFSPTDYLELSAVFNGSHPETGEDLVVVDEAPEGVPAHDLPSQPAVFAPDYAPEEIAEIAEKLRLKAGLSKNPTGEVANGKRSTSKPRRAARKKTPAKR